MAQPYTSTPEQALAAARAALPLENLVSNLTGKRPEKYMTCVFCEKRRKFGIFVHNGSKLFKCFNPGCVAHDSGDEVSFIMLWENVDRKTAFKEFLRLAGVSQ